MHVFVSVDLHWKHGEGDPGPKPVPDAGGGPLHPSEPSLLVQQRRDLYESGDPGMSFTR